MSETIGRRNGKKGACLRYDAHGIELLTTRNGYQWSGCSVDAELLDMIEEVISEFKRLMADNAKHDEETK